MQHNRENSKAKKADKNEVTQAGDKKAPKGLKKWQKGLIIALAAIVLIAAAFYAYWKISTKPPEIIPDETEEDEITSIGDGRYYTTLVVGEDQEGFNTDTIMFLRYDTVEKQVNIVSIPRDTLVNVSWGVKKINSVYYNGGGIEALKDEIQNISGIRPDNYVIIDMDVFIEVVNAMGGVWFDVPRDMNYADRTVLDDGSLYEFTIDVDAGYQLLDGYDAIGVFRFRQNSDGTGYSGGDWDRIEVQHDLMMAIAQQALETRNFAKLAGIAKAVLSHCTTDFSLGNVQWYLQEFLAMDGMDSITFYTAPTGECLINGLSYVTLYADQWLEIVNQHFATSDKVITKEDVCIMQALNPQLDKRGVTPSNYYTTNGAEIRFNFSR